MSSAEKRHQTREEAAGGAVVPRNVPRNVIVQGEALEVLCGLPDGCVDAIVTDPPAGIAFMGKDWDAFRRRHNPNDVGRANVFGRTSAHAPHSYGESERGYFIETMTAIFSEALRVLKPGGHALVWALPRTSHWTGMALEDAGFEVRDSIHHLYSQGFPKSLNLHGEHEGLGTALKPAHEVWWLARKPLAEPTVAAQVLATGTGALNIAACRVPHDEDASRQQHQHAASSGMRGIGVGGFKSNHTQSIYNTEGRWPPNLLLSHAATCDADGCADDCPVRELDAQSGSLTSGVGAVKRASGSGYAPNAYGRESRAAGTPMVEYGDTGGASRYFPQFRYVPKATRGERGHGNTHPTVKPLDLLLWLVRLITPPGGLVLDPFAGSGTTGLAAKLLGMDYLLIEQDALSCRIARRRIAFGRRTVQTPRATHSAAPVATLWGTLVDATADDSADGEGGGQ